MKKILSLVLALALVLAASAAFADVPGNIKDIEGLPEMPEVPTMTTHVSGTTETIVVSEKLNWLNWINNWNWNQIEWSEDGLTGTFSLAGLHSQPGFGNYLYSYEFGGPDWWTYTKGTWTGDYVNCYRYPHEHRIERGKKVESYDPGDLTITTIPVEKCGYWNDEDGYRHWFKYIDYIVKYSYSTATVGSHPAGVDQIDYSTTVFGFGTYEMGATVGNSDDFGRKNAPVYQGMAFDGEAANGAHVRYDRFGRCISITSTLTGVNFLNMENEPVKTEVTWGVNVTDYGRKWYIASIKAYIDDETAVEAGYASGGKLLKVK